LQSGLKINEDEKLGCNNFYPSIYILIRELINMKKTLKIVLYFIILPIVLFFVITYIQAISQIEMFGGPAFGFPFQYYQESCGYGEPVEGTFVPYKNYNFINLIIDIIILYAIFGIAYYIIEIRRAKVHRKN
jgi:large-conductance mechanosensitive channel